MNKIHESKFLDKFLYYHVEISFKNYMNNKTKNGYLYKNNKGYFLRTRDGDLYFYKSHVKRIVTCCQKKDQGGKK